MSNPDINELYTRLNKIIGTITDEKLRNAMFEMVDDNKYPFCAAPASSHTEFGGAYTGGLLQYCINTARILRRLDNATASKIPMNDIIVAGLFHHFGKIGYYTNSNGEIIPVYVKNNSDWHIQRGIMYDISPEYKNTNHNITSLYYLHKYAAKHGANLSFDVINAISTMHTKPNAFAHENAEIYGVSELTILLQSASRMAWKQF